MKKTGFLAIMLLLIFSACRKDVDEVVNTTTTHTPPILEQWEQGETLVEGDVIGFVVDESQTPVANAIVRLGNLNTTTDDYGHFFFENITMNKEGTVVQIDKAGFFNGSRRFFPLADAKNRVQIELLDKTFSQSFEASADESITMNGGAKVDFTANSIVDANGNSYNGTVNIATKWMDPSSFSILNQMPGNLQGVDQTATEVALSTFGMVAVELEGSNGQPLNIADGQTATVSMPVPASLQGVAPATIPLWSYNEEHGIWVEESEATLTNGVYVGEVSHFSFWNCDAPFPLVELDLRLIDEEGFPVSNHQVTLTPPTGWSGSGYSGQDGEVSGKVPANVEMVMEVYNRCWEVIYTQTVGPFSTNTSLGDITLTGLGINSTEVKGNLLNCSGGPVTNGLVIVYFGGQSRYEYVDNSSFEIRLSTCSAITDIEIRAINLDDMEESELLSSAANGQYDLGDINVCGQQVSEYLQLTVDGVTANYVNVTVQVSPDSSATGGFTTISYNGINGQDSTFGYFGFSGADIGNYNGIENFIEIMFDSDKEWDLRSGNPNMGGFDNFDVTEFGANAGDYIVGNFSGTVTNSWTGTGVTVTVSGEFRIKRR